VGFKPAGVRLLSFFLEPGHGKSTGNKDKPERRCSNSGLATAMSQVVESEHAGIHKRVHIFPIVVKCVGS
jgi:hypothetical protein